MVVAALGATGVANADTSGARALVGARAAPAPITTQAVERRPPQTDDAFVHWLGKGLQTGPEHDSKEMLPFYADGSVQIEELAKFVRQVEAPPCDRRTVLAKDVEALCRSVGSLFEVRGFGKGNIRVRHLRIAESPFHGVHPKLAQRQMMRTPPLLCPQMVKRHRTWNRRKRRQRRRVAAPAMAVSTDDESESD